MALRDKTREDLSLGRETERVAREQPDLEEQLRRYQREWKVFRESVGAGSQKTGATPPRKRRYRA
jgi:hypothetical protein